jgi:hypothetical protein
LEQTSLAPFIEIIGESLPIFGVWAGVTYLLAETGLAIGIVIAIIAGETVVLAFQDEIVAWIVHRGYKCPNCGAVAWETWPVLASNGR